MKKFLIILFSFVYLLISQGNCWAAGRNADVPAEYTLSSRDFSVTQAPYLLAEGLTIRPKTNIWVMSIFILGLGQMLMGDVWRGLRFYLYEAIIVSVAL